jgi:hypothetical protein
MAVPQVAYPPADDKSGIDGREDRPAPPSCPAVVTERAVAREGDPNV